MSQIHSFNGTSRVHVFLFKYTPIIIGIILLLLLLSSSCSSGGNPDTTTITPLPADTFLFLRSKPKEKVKHLYAYDLKTRKETLITDFDNSEILSEITLSPDRRWVTFTSLTFRAEVPKQMQALANVLNYHLWKVSVDGKQFVRLSHFDTAQLKPCPDFINSYDRYQQICTYEHSQPSFSSDIKTIYYSFSFIQNIAGSIRCNSNADCPGQSECYNQSSCHGIRVRGSSNLYRIALHGGVEENLPVNGGCLFEGNPVFNHAGDSMLFSLDFCSGNTREGIHIMKAPFDRQTFRFVVADNVKGKTIIWKSDDSGFIYQSGRDIKEYNFAYKSTALRFQYKKGSIEGFSPNADQSKLIIALQPEHKTVANLYLMDMETAKLEKLTSGYNDRQPCWNP